jgi:Domain of unknown function (DUF4383)
MRWKPLADVQGALVLGFARLVANVLLAFGVVGLLMTGFDYFSNVTGIPFLMFTINPNTNVIHVMAGLVGIGMTAGALLARRYLLLIGVLGLPWAIAGYIVDGTMADFFARNIALVNLHLAIALIALLLVFFPVWPHLAPTSERNGKTELG